MKIVVLDGYHLNPGDLDWSGIKQLGEVVLYVSTPEHLIVQRSAEADIVITNKVPFGKEVLDQLPNLKCICVSATGYNIIDTKVAKQNGIVVCNAPSYSSESVAQHVFASIFAIYNRIETYSKEVKAGVWAEKNDWSYTNEPVTNVYHKTLGIIGFGQIGQKVNEIAQSLGMKVISHHRHPRRDERPGVGFVDLDTLFEASDIITLHVPLNESTKNLINKDSLAKMKASSILINTGRGPLIDEEALASSLKNKQIRAAVLDVLVNEPPEKNNPLYDCENCYITPHIAWAGVEARKKLMRILEANVEAFKQGSPINVVNA
ncbi:D-2-hydroxyacid dehydrogenase [Portibacter lacus]|uniref:Glycerate dehydrogenase n=1 Tax=Portibacter lacus TaxID=1099794 RepID=A0AA37SUX9_9BACT|nr:D-2-hydroxyacid dehydrogenase [Portibacter lacus]GLR20074.1 glycerate dehydrogenase [Portibacter lacus]